jgi:hypothetical protein
VKRQFELVRRGVVLEEGSGMAYTFTKLNAIKPAWWPTRPRTRAHPPNSSPRTAAPAVGTIKSATQGYFEINARDGDSGGGWGVSDTPLQKGPRGHDGRFLPALNFPLPAQQKARPA